MGKLSEEEQRRGTDLQGNDNANQWRGRSIKSKLNQYESPKQEGTRNDSTTKTN